MGLVVNMDRLRLEALGISLGVVGAEEEVEPREKGGANVGLSTASIATID